jgi:phosphoserine phosphatase
MTVSTAELSSWNDGPTKFAITDFVARVTKEGGPDYVEPAARVAVFDNDGTLWTEKPLVIQLDFTIRRFRELAEDDTELRTQQPYQAAYESDMHWLGGAVVKHYHGDDSDLKLLMVAVPYRSCGYAPMVELLHCLEANGFVTYIASGGDRDFVRPVAEGMYGIPPERIIGSALGITYSSEGGQSALLYKGAMDFFDDGPEKPVRIWSRIGRRPILAFGNSNGDVPMLAFSGTPSTPSLRLLLVHDDADREFDYTAGAEQALETASRENWTVVSMKNDWAEIFPAPSS